MSNNSDGLNKFFNKKKINKFNNILFRYIHGKYLPNFFKAFDILEKSINELDRKILFKFYDNNLKNNETLLEI